MRMHRSRIVAFVSITLGSIAWSETQIPTQFQTNVPFELGATEFLPGDSITIKEVRGTSSTICTGDTFSVEGTYTLRSRDRAQIALYATTIKVVATSTDLTQIMQIEKGTGTFRLVKTMREEGYLHVSFYPIPDGSSFGGVYFGQGKWVLKHKGWSIIDTMNSKGRDSSRPSSAADAQMVLAGANWTIFKYLGEPVPVPADMDTAYSKAGLTEAVQTAARNAGVSVRRIEIDDSEFPFLIGLVCKEGDFAKLTEQFRKMPAYSYNGCISTSTHSALNLVPQRAFPPENSLRISHRTGIRSQIFFDKLMSLPVENGK